MIPSLKQDDPKQLNPSKGCIEGVRRAGGEVVVIDYDADRATQDALIRSLDALLFQGGGDVHPSRFGQVMHPKSGTPNLLRDELELRAFELMFPRGVPMLGVCRGAQVLNIALGGDIHQDIPSLLGKEHDLGEAPQPDHEVIVAPGTKLMEIMKKDRFPTNSLHHQSVARLGRGLVASAHTQDGIVEAIELPGHRFLLGLQWHPELMLDDGLSMRIFDAFLRSMRA